MRNNRTATKRERTGSPSHQLASKSRTLARIAKRLKDARIVRVNVNYLTDGDQIISFAFEPFNRRGKMVRASNVPDGLVLECECLLWFRGLQTRRYPRWWAGAGGFGRFEWNLTRNTLTHYHHARTIQVKTTRREGF